jgi:predicted transcriptional regulator
VKRTPSRDGAAIRQERLQMIVELVRKEPGARIERIQILIAMRTGLTPSRVSEYVRELISGELLAEVDCGFEVVKKR